MLFVSTIFLILRNVRKVVRTGSGDFSLTGAILECSAYQQRGPRLGWVERTHTAIPLFKAVKFEIAICEMRLFTNLTYFVLQKYIFFNTTVIFFYFFQI